MVADIWISASFKQHLDNFFFASQRSYMQTSHPIIKYRLGRGTRHEQRLHNLRMPIC